MEFPSHPSIDKLIQRPPAMRLFEDKYRFTCMHSMMQNHVKMQLGALLAMVSVRDGDEELLIPTVQRLIRQTQEAGTTPKVVIGLNNGATLSPFSTAMLKMSADVREMSLKQKEDFDQPTVIENDSRRAFRTKEGTPSIVIMHQPKSPVSAGKSRMLREATDVMKQNIQEGWEPPKDTVLIDTESWVMRAPARGQKIDVETNGFIPFMERLNESHSAKQVDLLGMRTYATAYDRVNAMMQPNFDTLIPRLHHNGNILRALPHSQSIFGSGMGGPTNVMLPLVDVVTQYPGMCAEDYAQNRLANEMGLRVATEHNTLVTNRTFSIAEGLRGLKQFARWKKTEAAVDQNWGIAPQRQSFLQLLGPRLLNFFRLYGADLSRYVDVQKEKKQLADIMKELPEECLIESEAAWHHH